MNHAGFRAAKRSRFRAGGLLSHPGETQHHVCKCDSDRTDVTMEETEGTYRRKKTLWGILGGMGPLSSAGFLATVYRLEAASEQEMPMIILISDPDVPDRTDAIVKLGQIQPKQYEAVKNRLKEQLEALWAMNIDRIVIACVTAHCFLPRCCDLRHSDSSDVITRTCKAG